MPGKIPTSPQRPGKKKISGDGLINLLRSSHIFASAVRELLESKPPKKAAPVPLTISQFHLLKLMTYNGQHQLCEVADFLGVSPPAATKNVDKLERLGLVVRRPSPDDRRVTLLSVSRRGRRLVDRYEQIKMAGLLPVLDHFDPKEIDQLSALLERFSILLLKNEQTRRRFCLRCDAYIESNCPVAEVWGGCPYRMSRRAQSRPMASAQEGTR